MKENENTRKYKHYLYYLIEYLKTNPKAFSESLGFNRVDRVYNVLKGKNGISSNLATIITDKYPEVSYNWLITGSGSMIVDPLLTNVKIKESYVYPSIEDQIIKVVNKSNKKIDAVTPVSNESYMWVEYQDLATAAGVLGGESVADLPDVKKKLVPREYDSGNYLVVRVDGDSMDDGSKYSIPNGSEILIKEYNLNNGDTLPIRNNLFVIVSREGTVFKQIIKHVPGEYITCHSYNKKFKDFDISMEEIIQIFIYRKVVNTRPEIPDII